MNPIGLPQGVETEEVELSPEVERDIEVFELEAERYRRGAIAEDQFKAFRLQHGVYDQRQANVQMLRVKIPSGRLNADQLDLLADISVEYSSGVAHLTTRQDVQFHYVELDNVVTIMRRLAANGLTTREACGNTVRNVTSCPYAGVCHDEVFDVTPLASAVSAHFLRNPVCQQLGRKFKISFSGCADHSCAMAQMHDIGVVAARREVNGSLEYGAKVYVAGGLGAVPMPAQVLEEFVPLEELVALFEAIMRVFHKYGERQNRNKARMKFLLTNLGLEEFRKRLAEARREVKPEPQWNQFIEQTLFNERGAGELVDIEPLNGAGADPAYRAWRDTNVLQQRQPGYSAVSVFLELGDISTAQLHGLADVVRRFGIGEIRATQQQNFLLRWVRNADLGALQEALRAVDLERPGAHTILDVTACPGSDTCNLGITASKGLVRQLGETLLDSELGDFEDLRIKISGCPNSCAQHHIANIGFFGSSRRTGDHIAPTYQMVLGGRSDHNAASFGLATLKLPAKNVPAAVTRLLTLYRGGRRNAEHFNDFIERLGKQRVKEYLADLEVIRPYGDNPEPYIDWGQTDEFSLKDKGIGECAGQLLGLVELKLNDSDRTIFEANLLYEGEKLRPAYERAYEAMLIAAEGLLSTQDIQPSPDQDIKELFRHHFVATGLVFDATANYFLKAQPLNGETPTGQTVHESIEKATLFIEECHNSYARM